MEWRCAWCGKPHAEDDPPCDNCGHGTFEKAVVPVGPEGEGGPTVWTCTACGRDHPRNNPPCSRCGNMHLERREQEFDPDAPLASDGRPERAREDVDLADGTGGPESTTVWTCTECGRDHPRNNPPCSRCGNMHLERRERRLGDVQQTGGTWLDAMDLRYALGFFAAFLLLGLFVAGATGVVDVPGFQSGVPTVTDVPGDASSAAGLSLSEVERAYVAELNERRTDAGRDRLEWSDELADRATYTNQRVVEATYGSAAEPTEEELRRELPETDRCTGRVYYGDVRLGERPASAFASEEALATALVDEYVRLSAGFRGVTDGFVGVDVHVGPDGTPFATQFVC